MIIIGEKSHKIPMDLESWNFEDAHNNNPHRLTYSDFNVLTNVRKVYKRKSTRGNKGSK